LNTYATSHDASQLRFAVVVSRFNQPVGARLLDGCARELEERGVASGDIDVLWVPGAFELPQAVRALAATGRYDAVVALGAVIRGGTPHFDYVCRAVTDGIREVIRDTGIPVGFGVLTTEDGDQAFDRAGGEHGNKGTEAARAAIEMARLVERLAAPPEAPGGAPAPSSSRAERGAKSRLGS
jgi:6,7-dimethyl-8-ribityllumazine synthase